MSWNKYVDYIVARAFRALNILKSLARTYWGADPKVLLLLYKSLIRSHFEYGAICFASNNTLLKKLEVVQNTVLRLITGAFKTTPINIMQIECNIPPLIVRFNYLKNRFLLKLYSLENNNLFRSLLRAQTLILNTSSLFLLHNFSEYLQLLKSSNIKRTEIWPCFEGNYESYYVNITVQIDPSLTSKELFYEYISSWSNYRVVYTDAAKNENSTSIAVYDSTVKMGTGEKIDSNASVFSAEAFAILSALHYIESRKTASLKWVIASDSMSVLVSLNNCKMDTKTNYIIYEIKKKTAQLYKNGFVIAFIWVPAHSGIRGNENADFLAKTITKLQSCQNIKFCSVVLPYTDILKKLKNIMVREWQEVRNSPENANKGSWYKFKDDMNKKPWFCQGKIFRNRKYYSIICRLRFGHCRINSHLHRMKLTESPLCNFCNSNESQTLDHIFFSCASFGIQRLVLIDELINIYKKIEDVPRSVQDLLKNPSNYKYLYEYIINTIQEI